MHITVQQFDINKRITNQNKRNAVHRNEWIESGASRGKYCAGKTCAAFNDIRCVHSARMHRSLCRRQCIALRVRRIRVCHMKCSPLFRMLYSHTCLQCVRQEQQSDSRVIALVCLPLRMNELPFCSVLFCQNELATGLREWFKNIHLLALIHAREHTLTRRESERYRFNSLHFIGFYPAGMTYDVYVGQPIKRATSSGTIFTASLWFRSCSVVWLGSNFQTHHTGSTVVL